MILEHVLIFGIDGCGPFKAQARTPHMDAVLKAQTCKGKAVFPTISAECWGTMLLGIPPEEHGLTNAIIEDPTLADKPNIPAMSIFAKLNIQRPNAKMGSFCEWTPINNGIIEDWAGVQMGEGGTDAITAQARKMIAENRYSLLFTHYDSVDAAGHSHGYGSREHIAAIEALDAEFGKVWQSVVDADAEETTLVIAVTDHGGNEFCSHGGKSDNEINVFIGFGGANVKAADIDGVGLIDIAPTVAYALGIRRDKHWTGTVPMQIFGK